jgi:chemotaxis signal transduction protein
MVHFPSLTHVCCFLILTACSALQLREAVVPLVDLWELMDPPEEERRGFRKVTAVLSLDKDEALSSGVLSVATIKKVHTELNSDRVISSVP